MKPTLPTLAGKTTRDVEVAIRRIRDYSDGLKQKISVLKAIIAGRPGDRTLAEINAALSATGSHPLNVTGLVGTTATQFPSTAGLPVPPPTPGVCHSDLAGGQPSGPPAAPNLRWFRGDFYGISVPGTTRPPQVQGADPTVILTSAIGLYSVADQTAIFTAYRDRGYTHWVLSWSDSRDVFGQTIPQFVATAQLVQANGFYPMIFLTSGDTDSFNLDPTTLDPVMAALVAGGCIPIACAGVELNEFYDPGPPVQGLIDHVHAALPATNLYVHFTAGHAAMPGPGQTEATWWAAQVGKLTGLLYQKDIAQSCVDYQDRLNDFMIRFGAGVNGWPQDSGFGHPFDLVAYEYAGLARANGSMSEAQAQVVGNESVSTPAVPITTGPYAGQTYVVQGFCNGGPHV